MTKKHLIDTGKRLVVIHVEERETEIHIETIYSVYGQCGDEHHLAKIIADAIGRFDSDKRDIIYRNRNTMFFGRMQANGQRLWVSSNGGSGGPGGGFGGGGSPDSPLIPDGGGRGASAPNQAIVVDAVESDKFDSELASA